MTKVKHQDIRPWIDGLRENVSSLSEYAKKQRWFRSKVRNIKNVTVHDSVLTEEKNQIYILSMIAFDFEEGESEIYFIPFIAKQAEDLRENDHVVLSFQRGSLSYSLLDAFQDKDFEKWLFDQIEKSALLESEKGLLKFQPREGLGLRNLIASQIYNLKAEQSNTSIVANDQYILKVYRKLESSVNPEVEMLDFLREHQYSHVPKLFADIAYEHRAGRSSTLGLMVEFVKGASDGWSYALGELKKIYEQKTSQDNLMQNINRIGQLTGKLHQTLAMDDRDDRFAPEVISKQDTESWENSFHLLTSKVIGIIKQKNVPDPVTQEKLKAIAHQEGRLKAASVAQHVLYEKGIRKIRYHGDYHLGQVLQGPRGWLLFDFEGEPLRSLEDRKKKTCVLKDVAGMLRSFSYATHVSSRDFICQTKLSSEKMEEIRGSVEVAMREAFLKGYFDTVFSPETRKTVFLSSIREENEALLYFYELDKAIYELHYELNNRPDWMDVPLNGIQCLLKQR